MQQQIIDSRSWRALIASITVCGLSLVLSGILLYQLHTANRDAAALVVRLQRQQTATDAANARDTRNVALAQQRLLALTRFALALQGQVRSLGATPAPLPSQLRTAPAFETSRPAPAGSSTPTPSARPSPSSTASAPPPAPSPTPSPTCLARVGQVCLG